LLANQSRKNRVKPAGTGQDKTGINVGNSSENQGLYGTARDYISPVQPFS